VLISTAPLAAAMPGIGSWVLGRLANAELQFSGIGVFGMLGDQPVEMSVGGVDVRARRKLFLCMSADLSEAAGTVAIGAACTLDGEPWQVADIAPQPGIGQVLLSLERP